QEPSRRARRRAMKRRSRRATGSAAPSGRPSGTGGGRKPLAYDLRDAALPCGTDPCLCALRLRWLVLGILSGNHLVKVEVRSFPGPEARGRARVPTSTTAALKGLPSSQPRPRQLVLHPARVMVVGGEQEERVKRRANSQP